MPARLFCETGELAGSAYLIDREAFIGRQHENEIVLHPAFISGRHARIYFDDGENRYFLEDLGSSNGTLLDGVAVTESMRLDRLHVISFAGLVDFIFQRLSKTPGKRAEAAPPRAPAAPAEPDDLVTEAARDAGEKTRVGDFFDALPPLSPEQTAEGDPNERTRAGDFFGALPAFGDEGEGDEAEKTLSGLPLGDLPPLPELQDPWEKTPAEEAAPATSPPTEPASAPGDDETVAEAEPSAQPASFVLEVTLPDGVRRVFPLQEGGNVVGREPTCDVVLPDASISRNHALLTLQTGRVLLKDLGSKNATFVDEERVTAEVEIFPGAALRFGLSVTAILRS